MQAFHSSFLSRELSSDRKMQQEKAAWELYANIPDPLHWVASIGDHVAIRQLVSGSDGAKMIPRSEQDSSARTPLMKSCERIRRNAVSPYTLQVSGGKAQQRNS